MVEDHRRVEGRQGVAGTGMATDPERITRIADDAARRERSWRATPEIGFGDILRDTPARGDREFEEPPRRARPPEPRGEGEGEGEGPTNVDAMQAPGEEPRRPDAVPGTPSPARPLRAAVRAPDPRAQRLHAQLDARRTPSTATSTTSSSSSTSAPSTAGTRSPRKPT